jgi:predicted DCC family thiol-disulfide oxidoreductase YuxK
MERAPKGADGIGAGTTHGRKAPPAAEDAALAALTGDPAGSPRVALTVFYDGGCRFCRERVRRYQRASAGGARLIAWCDVGAAPWALKRWRIGSETARRRLHVVDAEGRIYAGAAAFSQLWRALPGHRWLGIAIGLPGVAPAAQAVYRLLAALAGRRRHRRRLMDGPRVA